MSERPPFPPGFDAIIISIAAYVQQAVDEAVRAATERKSEAHLRSKGMNTPRTDAALAATLDSCGFLDTKTHGALTDLARALEQGPLSEQFIQEAMRLSGVWRNATTIEDAVLAAENLEAHLRSKG